MIASVILAVFLFLLSITVLPGLLVPSLFLFRRVSKWTLYTHYLMEDLIYGVETGRDAFNGKRKERV